MFRDKTFLAIIPARGGSKRLPRKNLLELNKKPLIAWSIQAATNSKYIDRVIVSSDDDEVLSVSQKFGAEVIKRPQELASDTATTFDALEHTIANIDKKYDFIILLQPTSPLRDEVHIDEAIELLMSREADAVISVCEMEHSPLWSNTLSESKSMKSFLNKNLLNRRSQDLDTYYRLNGAIYICKRDIFLEKQTFFIEDNIFAYEMEGKKSVDIDEELDFLFAKTLLEYNSN